MKLGRRTPRASVSVLYAAPIFALYVAACGSSDAEPPEGNSEPTTTAPSSTTTSGAPTGPASTVGGAPTTPGPTASTPSSSATAPLTSPFSGSSSSSVPEGSENLPSPGQTSEDGTGSHGSPSSEDSDGSSDEPVTNEPSTSDDPTTEPSPSPPVNPGNCSPKTNERVAVGYGAKTTGGGNATAVTVNSFEQAVEALAAYRNAFKDGTQRSLVVRYTGKFDFASLNDVCAQHTKASQIVNIKEVENVTFEGAPNSSANFGIKINRAKNVIVRNMTMGLLPGGGDSDAITIEGNGTNGDVENVWIDHNTLFSSTKDDCDGAGDTEFDGLIDIKKGARYITVSYNHLHDHQKTGLLGSSDSDDMDRYVTFHHNWYENVVSRTPLHRFGYIHMYNNYFNRVLDSGINVRMGGVALIESNYFENTKNPVTSRYSDQVGYWDLKNNHVGANITWSTTADTLANADDWKSTKTFPTNELTYAYDPDDAQCVKTIVTQRAGATLQ